MLTDDITWIGPFGALRPIHCPPPEIGLRAERPNASGITLAGRRYTQQAPRAPRTWTWNLDVAPLADLVELLALESGAYGRAPWWWYDLFGARFNMLSASVAVPASAVDLDDVVTDAGTPPAAGTPVVLNEEALIDGCEDVIVTARRIAYSVDFTGGLILPAHGLDPDPLVVIPGRPYTGSVYGTQSLSDAAGWRIVLVWVDADQLEIDRVNGTTIGPGIAPERSVASGVAPANAAGAYLRVEALDAAESVENVTAAQLTETAELIGWQPGWGVHRVSIPEGFDAVYLLTRTAGDMYRRSLQLTLVEVC